MGVRHIYICHDISIVPLGLLLTHNAEYYLLHYMYSGTFLERSLPCETMYLKRLHILGRRAQYI